jgi:hypothetical protein
MMEQFDNILTPLVFDRLRSELLSNSFPWFYGRVVTLDPFNNNLFLYGWSHILLEENRPNPHYKQLELAIISALDNANQPVDKILRVRAILNTVTDKPYTNGVHVDFTTPHRTALIYLNDSDGSTILYREKYGTTLDLQNLTIEHQVTPKENRMICFDGLQYHTGTTPVSTARRVVINVNYTIK